jgi:hypothetical protein
MKTCVMPPSSKARLRKTAYNWAHEVLSISSRMKQKHRLVFAPYYAGGVERFGKVHKVVDIESQVEVSAW